MNAFRQLMVVEAVALGALLAVAAAMAAYGAFEAARHGNSLLGPADSAQVIFGYTALLGVLPATLIGAPGYLILLRHGSARWPHVLALGTFPGILMLPFERSLGFWAIFCGAAVAALTHLACLRLRSLAPIGRIR